MALEIMEIDKISQGNVCSKKRKKIEYASIK
jgi:hypothetical protein